jgi:diacylglycerol kinase family enzyme
MSDDRPATDPSAYLLLANAAAGSADEEAVELAAATLAARGAEVEVRRSADIADVDRALDGLGGRTLVVCGGDGSVHLAVARLHARDALDTPVGLVPLGTGNDLARAFGLPLDDPAAAATRLLEGRAAPLDLLLDDTGRVCVNALHAGLGATAAARAESMKAALSELAYPVGALLAGLSEGGVAARVVVDGGTVWDDEVLLIAVCNTPGFGGGTVVAPGADAADGVLDVVVVGATGPVARAAFGLALQRGEHLDREDVRLARGRQVRIEGAGLRYDVDGEVGEDLEEVRTWRVLPAAWRLVR